MARKNLYNLIGLLLIPLSYHIALLTNTKTQTLILYSIIASIIGCFLTIFFIPYVKEMTFKAGLSGKDINKPTSKEEVRIPEALGIVPATLYLCIVIPFQLIHPHALAEYNAGLTSLCFILFLGFADDVLNLRWRYKIILPVIATLPLLVSYTGKTNVIVPPFFTENFDLSALNLDVSYSKAGVPSINLGPLYMVYMGLLSVYCSNAINIFAGINGLEAGQSLIISASILYFNLSHVDDNGPFSKHHLFSVFLVFPFFFVTAGLLYYNWFPSSVFVGDTYTLFAGMVFAVASILGHFSETLLLLFIPQTINFLYSIPQLIGIVPCPRHRLPKFNPTTGKLEGIPSNLNLVNLTLLLLGPMTEKDLCLVLLGFQCLCNVFGLWLRQQLIPYFRVDESMNIPIPQ